MTRPLKLYGGTYDGIHRTIVAATSKKAAYEAMSKVSYFGSYTTWNDYTGEGTFEGPEAIAAEYPGVVFRTEYRSMSDRNYKRIDPPTKK